MKHKIKLFFFTLLLLAAFTSGCGNREESAGYHDVKAETEQLPDATKEFDTSDMIEYVYLGSQFLGEEKIQLWGERKLDGGSVYLHREDGTRELLAEGVNGRYLGTYKWRIDDEGRCYLFSTSEIMRQNPDKTPGEDDVIFETKSKNGEIFSDICQLQDGRIIVLISENQHMRLAELNPDSGRLNDIQDIPREIHGADLVAAEGSGLVLLGFEGIWSVSLEDGTAECLLSFSGTSYVLGEDGIFSSAERVKEDFRLPKEGQVELLWSDGTLETLNLEQIDKEKEILVLRTGFSGTWMKEQIVRFNQENKKYTIIIEEPDSSDILGFREKTDLDLGSGKGADLICGSAVNDLYSLLEKGAFADLTSFMESSGIKEENYFPATFSAGKHEGKIYALNYMAEIESLWIDRTVAGDEPVSDAEDLADRLLAYEGDAIFQKYNSSANVLYFFLQNSESLCGMVDFENGTCDFSGKLFEKMLQAAKKYGYDETHTAEVVAAGKVEYRNFYCFPDSAFLTEEGKIPMGYLFDDGIYPKMKNNLIAINVHSDMQKGAWEFILFLLAEESQASFYMESDSSDYVNFPVDKKIFERLCKNHSPEINGGNDVKVFDNNELTNKRTGLTEERKMALTAALENACSAPLGTEPLIKIITEEAEAYFSGTRNLDEVRALIENRVRLYLNEHN